jgi:AcrR family transcriptional regulator
LSEQGIPFSLRTITERSAPIMDDIATHRKRRGRQAEAARNDRRVLDAAREVIAAQGFEAPVSAIAERAGVGIGSLYRRYGSKEELLQRLCVLAMEQAIAAAEAGLADEDPWRGLTRYVQDCVTFGSGALAPLAGRIATTPEMRATAARSFDLLERLVQRAALRPGASSIDVAWLTELFSRTRPRDASPEDARVHERLLAIALDGLRDGVPAPLPGPAPTLEHYAGRWGED